MTKRLLLLNGLAILVLPFHHAAAFGLFAMFQWTNRYRPVTVPNFDQLGTTSYYVTILIRQLDAFAIPAFLFVSGFFIAFMVRGSQSTLKWHMVMPRIKVILFPWIIWILIHYLLLRRLPSSINDIFGPYYFIVLLIQFYLLSPLIVPFVKTRWRLLLFVVALIQLGTESLRYLIVLGVEIPALEFLIQITPLWFFPSRIFYFTVGVVAGAHVNPFHQWLVQVRWVLLTVVIISVVLSFVEYELIDRLTDESWLGPNNPGIARIVYGTVFPLCFLAFGNVSIPWSKELSLLGSRSLGVYLANSPVIYVAGSMMYHLTPWALGQQIIYQSVLIAVGLGIPLLLMAVMRKSRVRWAYRYVFG